MKKMVAFEVRPDAGDGLWMDDSAGNRRRLSDTRHAPELPLMRALTYRARIESHAGPAGLWLMDGERIDRFLTQLYERLGDRYPKRLWRVAWGAFLLSGVAGGFAFRPYLHPSSGQFWGFFGLTEAGLVVMMLIGSRLWTAHERVLTAWWQVDRPSEGAVKVWKVIGRMPITWLLGWPLGVLTVGVPTSIYSLIVLGRSFGESATLFAAWVGAGGYAALLGSFTVDLAVRPILRDAAARMPAGFDPGYARLPIARRLFAALLMISGSTGFFLSFGLSIESGSLGKLVLGLALTAGFTLTTALLSTVMITGSTARPIADLLIATRRIAAGELGARVPVASQDELGLLAASFNEMTAELQRSQVRIVNSADAERRRLERDLHDGAQQHLVLLKLKLGQLGRLIERDRPGAQALMDGLGADLDRALVELRDLAHGIYPTVLESDGLPAALVDAAGRAPIPVTVDCDGAGRYPPELETAVYFCCMEALQNASKHAGTDARATIRLAPQNGALLFAVADDGFGFEAGRVGASAGLQNMSDRIGALGGMLRIVSSPGEGTTVSGAVPIPQLAD
jgi:signal transduction histidine kinase